jgi:hypothetical protein
LCFENNTLGRIENLGFQSAKEERTKAHQTKTKMMNAPDRWPKCPIGPFEAAGGLALMRMMYHPRCMSTTNNTTTGKNSPWRQSGVENSGGPLLEPAYPASACATIMWQ